MVQHKFRYFLMRKMFFITFKNAYTNGKKNRKQKVNTHKYFIIKTKNSLFFKVAFCI